MFLNSIALADYIRTFYNYIIKKTVCEQNPEYCNKYEWRGLNFKSDFDSMYIAGARKFVKDPLLKHMFDKTDLSKDKRYFVYVGAANYLSTVTFNGELLGKHEGGYTPFCFEVTDLLKAKDNYLIIGVSNRRADDYIPGKVTDWFNHDGGHTDAPNFQTFIPWASKMLKYTKVAGR